MSKRTIIYGAGKRAAQALNTCVRGGYDVVAFCDSDRTRIGEEICGLRVISKEDVSRLLGNDFYVYISPARPVSDEIEEQLLSERFVDEKYIINRAPKRRYLSCSSLESVAVVTNEGIYSCCSLENIRNAAPYVKWKETIEETVGAFIEQRDRYIEELQDSNKTNPCTGCPALCNSKWDRDRRVTVLALSPSYPCQLACEYCELQSNAKYVAMHPEEVRKAKNIDIQELMKQLKEKGKFDPSEPIQLSGGEITLAPNKRELLQAVSDYPLQVFTNAIIYDPDVRDAVLKDARSFLNVSIDAGTAETYQIVKGMDAFGKVKDTLNRYHDDGIACLLKYIILPNNCNISDYEGFLEIAEQIDAKDVNISCDIYTDTREHSSEVVEGAIYLAKGCLKRGLNYTIMPYFGDDNLKYIHEQLNDI